MKKLLILISLITFNSYAHEGHDVPGALPPAPNGGVIKEAHHAHKGSGKHDHKKASEKEFFFEAIIKNKLLKIYPYVLNPKHFNTFDKQNISDFSGVTIKLYDPRKKKNYTPKVEVKNDSWELDVSKIKARRLIVNIKAINNKAVYKVKIQVEKK